MHRTLERLDALGSTLVPLLYLAGLALGTLAYFTGVTTDFNLAVGSALAVAVECHLFLQLRRTRATYGAFARMAEDDVRRDGMVRQFRVNLAILAALVSFSAYNATNFAAATWRPTSGFLPTLAQVAIRGLIIPVFFLLAGFLSPLTQDAGALLADASHTMLYKTLRTTLRQWKRRVDRAARRGLDLAPVAIALMRDAGDEDGARRVQLIASGLNEAEGLPGVPQPPTLPTGPGTPLAAPVRTPRQVEPSAPPAVLRLEQPPEWRRTAQGAARRGTHRRGVRTPHNGTTDPVEEKARGVWRSGMSVAQLERAAGISKSAAGKYRRVFRAEEAERAAAVAQ